MKKHNVYIIAGPNGVGKTTFAKEFLPQYAHCQNFVNADLIAAGLSPFAPQIAAVHAGRLVLRQISEFAGRGVDFGFETTLSGKTYFPILQDLKERGYRIHLFFLWVPDVRLSLERIKNRVRSGGHDVPRVDVERRFGRSIRNFLGAYGSIMDSWTLFDNSTSHPRVIARKERGDIKISDPDLFSNILRTKG